MKMDTVKDLMLYNLAIKCFNKNLQVYEKFKSGDFLLSPYTGWTIQLLNVVPINKGFALRRDVSFESFEKFVPYIDIELIGMGTYVDGQKALEAAGGKLNLDKFYERDSRLKTPFSF